jgi:hypothetical protein
MACCEDSFTFGACDNVLVEALCYELEDPAFDTR